MTSTSEAMAHLVEHLNGLYLCRETQISRLYEYLVRLCPTIIVYGLRSTAKTSVVKTLCETSHSLYAYIDCKEFFTNKMVYENILIQLNDKINCLETNQIHCQSLSHFIDHLKTILDQFVANANLKTKKSSKPVFSQCIIVLDSMDSNHHLINTSNNEIITSLIKIQELTQNVCPISCVFMSCQSSEWFCRITSSPVSAIQINFDNYSLQEMSTILTKDCPKGYDKHFYQNYVNIIVKTLIQMSSNLSEMRSICLAYFCKYVEPINSGHMCATDSAKLYKRFQPILVDIIEDISLKVVNSRADRHSWPDSMKYLLISSYNSVKNDKKVFVKYEGKKRKERKRKIVTEERDFSGPKGATFERLLHIYRALIELNAENDDQYLKDSSNKLLSELQELVALKLILRTQFTNKSNCLSSVTKYQISNSVNFDFIENLAQKLNLNIKAFIE